MMILYNTSMGVAAGLAMLAVVRFWTNIRALQATGDTAVVTSGTSVDGSAATLASALHGGHDTTFDPADFAPTFLALGSILAGLAGAMTVTHPLTANPPVNIVFGEPCLWLGVLLIAASFHVSRRRHVTIAAIKVASPVVFAVGLVLAACAAAILRFSLIGAAPVEEPITGLLNGYPAIENSFFAFLYALSAAGALAFPWLVTTRADAAWVVVRWSWSIAGVGFLVFSTLNFYTHIGLMVNLTRPGADFRF
ncbi:DUF981 family protein [Micromonospora sp. C51]|uniref:DUF981 family protein n=1 Tax=Micromonospora sp. C51 TaxID=2824879 RepID=UPI001B35B50C|nr:DUF981 family protein [Micromonospora sp. C51]MBQ1049268.1 DUF981 family protein [Micromonospora sp. C51]